MQVRTQRGVQGGLDEPRFFSWNEETKCMHTTRERGLLALIAVHV